METRDFVLPAAALIGGAVLGRLFGLRPIWRGAMAALALASASKGAGMIETHAVERRRAPRRKAITRAARKRVAHKKSAHAAS
jgi:hypothetical protein